MVERLPQPYPPEEFKAVDLYLSNNLLAEAELIAYDLRQTVSAVVGEACQFYGFCKTSIHDFSEYQELAQRPILQAVRRGNDFNYVDLYPYYDTDESGNPVSKHRLYMDDRHYLAMRLLQRMEEDRLKDVYGENPPIQFSQPVNNAIKHYRARYLMEQEGFRLRLVGWNTSSPMELAPIVETRIPDDCELPEDE